MRERQKGRVKRLEELIFKAQSALYDARELLNEMMEERGEPSHEMQRAKAEIAEALHNLTAASLEVDLMTIRKR